MQNPVEEKHFVIYNESTKYQKGKVLELCYWKEK